MISNRKALFADLAKASEGTPTILLEGRRAFVDVGEGFFEIPSGLFIPNGNRILLKLEHLKRSAGSGSLYDRLYPWVFSQLEEGGRIHPEETHVVECSVGNAGAAFANVASRLGYLDYSVILPSDMYEARRKQIRAFGARVLDSPSDLGAKGYIDQLEGWIAERVRRPKHGQAFSHYPVSKIRKVPLEPYARLVSECEKSLQVLGVQPQIDCYASVVGSGNALCQIGRAIKLGNPSAEVIAVDHIEQPYVSHLVEGITPPLYKRWSEPDFPATSLHDVPLEKLNLDLTVVDSALPLSRWDRDQGLDQLNRIGIEAGRTSGAAFAAAMRFSKMSTNRTFLTIVFDGINKYETEWRDNTSEIFSALIGRQEVVSAVQR